MRQALLSERPKASLDCPATRNPRIHPMLKVTYIDFHEKAGSAVHSGWYITDGNGAIIGDAHRYADQASGLQALMALC